MFRPFLALSLPAPEMTKVFVLAHLSVKSNTKQVVVKEMLFTDNNALTTHIVEDVCTVTLAYQSASRRPTLLAKTVETNP